jgi:hypothetical protein
MARNTLSELDERGYCRDWKSNLLTGIDSGAIEGDLQQGSGSELATKFRAPHSSSALAVNAFGPFREDPQPLRIRSHHGFKTLRFEQKCPSGLSGTPPNLDVVLEGDGPILAIESKCLEYMSRKDAEFAPAYFTDIQDERRETAWFAEMGRLSKEPADYRHLDAAQLIKHAMGLAHSFPGQSVTLLYVWWEPTNAESFPIFAHHRDEVLSFAQRVAGSDIRFEWTTYRQLWTQWSAEGLDAAHIAALHKRYSIEI